MPVVRAKYKEACMGIIKRTWRGELSLSKTFWLAWALPSVILSWVMSTNYFRLMVVKSVSISLPLSLFLTFGTPAIFFIYQVFMAISTWRSAQQYKGKKIWGIAAKGISIVYIVALLSLIGFSIFIRSKIDTDDPGKNSENIAQFLKEDPAYPLIGFWKNQCSENFGLSINKVDNGLYSVSFCGPGGCFKPGTYRPNTTIIGDSSYRVIDNNTIQVEGLDGFSTYMRCKQ
jgi:hypothetical protein